MSGLSVLAVWNGVLSEQWLGNELWRWLVLAASLGGAYLLSSLVAFGARHRASRLKAQGRLEMLALVLERLGWPLKLLALSATLYAAGTFMRYWRPAEGQTRPLHQWPLWDDLCRTIAVIAAAWFVMKLLDAVEVFFKSRSARMDVSLNARMVPMVRKTLRVVVLIIVFLFVARNILGWDVNALIAGLGIGGLAFALAARETLANVFGTAMILADQPFKLGDRVVVRGQDGHVEEVGFRSTRIRTSGGEIAILPNSVVANEMLLNLSRRPYIFQTLDLPLVDNLPLRDVRKAQQAVRCVLEGKSRDFAPGRPPRVSIIRLHGAASTLQVQYWYAPPDPHRHAQFLSDLYLDLARAVPAICPGRDVGD